MEGVSHPVVCFHDCFPTRPPGPAAMKRTATMTAAPPLLSPRPVALACQIDAADAFILEPVFFDALWREHLQLPLSPENEAAALGEVAARCAAGLEQLKLGGSVQQDLQVLAEAPKTERAYKLAAVRYAERRALQSAARALDARLSGLKQLQYYQDRRLESLGLTPIETEAELEALRADGADGAGGRAAGRRFDQDIEW